MLHIYGANDDRKLNYSCWKYENVIELFCDQRVIFLVLIQQNIKNKTLKCLILYHLKKFKPRKFWV